MSKKFGSSERQFLAVLEEMKSKSVDEQLMFFWDLSLFPILMLDESASYLDVFTPPAANRIFDDFIVGQKNENIQSRALYALQKLRQFNSAISDNPFYERLLGLAESAQYCDLLRTNALMCLRYSKGGSKFECTQKTIDRLLTIAEMHGQEAGNQALYIVRDALWGDKEEGSDIKFDVAAVRRRLQKIAFSHDLDGRGVAKTAQAIFNFLPRKSVISEVMPGTLSSRYKVFSVDDLINESLQLVFEYPLMDNDHKLRTLTGLLERLPNEFRLANPATIVVTAQQAIEAQCSDLLRDVALRFVKCAILINSRMWDFAMHRVSDDIVRNYHVSTEAVEKYRKVIGAMQDYSGEPPSRPSAPLNHKTDCAPQQIYLQT